LAGVIGPETLFKKEEADQLEIERLQERMSCSQREGEEEAEIDAGRGLREGIRSGSSEKHQNTKQVGPSPEQERGEEKAMK
jgi:hypothetical protein